MAFTGEEKKKKMKAADSSTTFENRSSVEPVTVGSDKPEKMDVSSPKLESKSKSNADLCEPSRVAVDSEVACGSMEMQDNPKPSMEESNGLDGIAKPISLEDQSAVPRLDFDIQDSTETKE